MLKETYGNEAMNRTKSCFELHSRFKNDQTSLEDDERPRRMNSATKSMIIVFFRHLRKENIRRKRPQLWEGNKWMIQDDNAPAHRGLATRQFCARNNMVVLYHQICLPATSFCFPK
ncbi:hypothetical protein C0J52_07592 [Blattella germanica]|nr:hypothetical protein C0J52_07592 [Blattella germanica]